MENTLTFALEGQASLEQFTQVMLYLQNSLAELTHQLAPEADIQWMIDDLQLEDMLATIAGIYTDPLVVQQIIEAFGAISTEPSHSPTALVELIQGGLTALRIETEHHNAIIGRADLPIVGKQSLGSVKGTVQMVSRRHLKFVLEDHLYQKVVTCYLQPDQTHWMADIWGKLVMVRGTVTRESETGRPFKVTQIQDIQILTEIKPGSYQVAEGVLAPYDDGEPSEVSLRRLRDDEQE